MWFIHTQMKRSPSLKSFFALLSPIVLSAFLFSPFVERAVGQPVCTNCSNVPDSRTCPDSSEKCPECRNQLFPATYADQLGHPTGAIFQVCSPGEDGWCVKSGSVYCKAVFDCNASVPINDTVCDEDGLCFSGEAYTDCVQFNPVFSHFEDERQDYGCDNSVEPS